jgi:glycosyltransferase involved in cell wall biosynthesis
MNRVLGLSWFEHRRMRELCAGIDVELAVINTSLKGAARYLLLAKRTIAFLSHRRPDILVVQNPSLVLCALSIVARRVLGYRLVVDAHNEAVVPFINTQKWLNRITDWILRRANLTIVTNGHLAQIVKARGGRPFVLPDRIPTPPDEAACQLEGGFKVVLIATFAPDEPVGSVFEAVRGAHVDLYVTGDHRKLERAVAANVPENVRFTGFLDEGDYWCLLKGADVIVDLTVMPNCLVCGAYEALAVGKPMVLSRNPASVDLFGEAAVFTDNSADDIRCALQKVRVEWLQRQAAVVNKRLELKDAWVVQARELMLTMEALNAPAGL